MTVRLFSLKNTGISALETEEEKRSILRKSEYTYFILRTTALFHYNREISILANSLLRYEAVTTRLSERAHFTIN
jgi:hypothetical protein